MNKFKAHKRNVNALNAFGEHASGISELMMELGEYCPFITIGGKQVSVLPTSARNGSKNEIGGLALESDLTFVAILSDFTTKPSSNQTFDYSGRRYKIADVSFAPGKLQVRISANDATK